MPTTVESPAVEVSLCLRQSISLSWLVLLDAVIGLLMLHVCVAQGTLSIIFIPAGASTTLTARLHSGQKLSLVCLQQMPWWQAGQDMHIAIDLHICAGCTGTGLNHACAVLLASCKAGAGSCFVLRHLSVASALLTTACMPAEEALEGSPGQRLNLAAARDNKLLRHANSSAPDAPYASPS